MQVHRVVLKRADGSELRRNYVGAFGELPRVGSIVLVGIAGLALGIARITAVETSTVLAPLRDGNYRPTELTVHAQELMCVPTAANDV